MIPSVERCRRPALSPRSAQGGDHTCGVKTDGSIGCWGSDWDGQATTPAGSFASVSAGGDYTCGVKTDGSVACWGNDEDGRATPPVGSFVSISARGSYTCGVVKTDGSATCWGNDDYGQASPPAGSFASVSAGGVHTCGVRTNGSITCWGRDSEGQSTPAVGSFSSVSAGVFHACGVKTAGSLACWGAGDLGQATPPTSEPTPTPSTDDACVEPLTSGGSTNDQWTDACDSANKSGSYARFYTFSLSESSEITITLESDEDTFLYLLEGAGRDGTALHENDDHKSESDCAANLASGTDSCIVATLAAGDYTIEATTYNAATTGDFTLTVSGMGGAPTVTPTPPTTPTPTTDECVDALSGDGSTNGQWTDACDSANKSGSYARYYTFTLSEASEVTITLESDEDTILYLLSGSGRDGDSLHENDDHADESDCAANLDSSTDSCIVATLDAGDYTIEATTYNAATTGDFTLTVSGLGSAATSAVTDRAVLVALYNATNGDDWKNNTNWLSDKPLSYWYGVRTDGDGRVTGLNLTSNELSGEILSELSRLASLQLLALGNNDLTGEIPSELGGLANLTKLYVLGNELTGEIPAELGDLSNLEGLWLYDNQLTGTIPSELSGLSNLTELSLWGNELTGEIPSELGSLSNLEDLWLSDNQLTGTIPSELSGLSNLTELSLWGNELTGEIPSELSSLSNLEWLLLNDNQLTGTIPSELGSLSNLTWLSLWGNALSGEIPPELGSLSSLTELALSGNDLSGEIPSELGSLSNLTWLSLWGNDLSGEIPSELLAISGLEIMTLYGNRITGGAPEHADEREVLTTLYNSTGGADWENSDNWSTAESVFNWYGVGIDTGGHATALLLSDNGLSGEILPELGSLTALVRLYLHDNDLSGEIPPELENLVNLERLYLGGNEFVGCIPDGLRDVSINDLYGIDLPLCSGEGQENLLPDLQGIDELRQRLLPESCLGPRHFESAHCSPGDFPVSAPDTEPETEAGSRNRP